jgi:hypothetical protein
MTLPLTIISLGPSIPLSEAKTLYPAGAYHAPFKCGDLLQLLRLKPTRIAIIDGMFEHTAAIWHKEILWALANGIEIYGASSMGALRASEMKAYGMEPIGKIAEHYLITEELDDDEVALTHDAKSNTTTLTMVDLRATLNHLLNQKLIQLEDTHRIIKQAKEIPYFKRRLSTLKLNPSEHSLLQSAWINQKQQDAILLLKRLARNEPLALLNKPCMVESIYFRRLYHEVWHAPFTHAYDWLPPFEQQYARCSPFEKALLTHFGKMAQLWADHLWDEQLIQQQPSLRELLQAVVPSAQVAMRERHLNIYYQQCFSQSNIHPHWIQKIAVLWDAVFNSFKKRQCELRPQTVQSFSNAWRRDHGLQSPQDTLAWRHSMKLDQAEEYAEFMIELAYFDIFISKNNGDALLYRGPLWKNSWVQEILELLRAC